MEMRTIVADITKGGDAPLQQLLGNTRAMTLFGTFPMLHFASFVIFDAKTLGTPLSKLVFDFTVDDGTVDAFVNACGENSEIQAIYASCAGQTVGAGYLWEHIRCPQLYHIGTPYRTVKSIRADADLRQRLNDRLLNSGPLPELLNRPVAGMLEYWNWEVLQPWLAVAIGLLVATLAPILFVKLWRADYRRLVKVILGGLEAIVAAGGVYEALALWLTALPLLRDRAKAWLPGLGGAVVVGIAAAFLWAKHHPVRSIVLASSFAILLALTAYAAARRRRNERLAELRQENDTRAIVRDWKLLLTSPRDADDAGPAWWRVAKNFKWWAVSVGVIWAGLSIMHSLGLDRWMVPLLTGFFGVEAVWLNVLIGWPDKSGPWLGFSAQGARFVAYVTLGALIVVWALTSLPLPYFVWSLGIPATFLALWGGNLASPPVPVPALTSAHLKGLADQEDRDVQNHMAAVVVLRDAGDLGTPQTLRSRVRIWSLNAFLGILNHIFYRAWLPDVCKGKLFKLPTVHAAQWLVLDRRNFLFLSNYDNSWTTYLDDFGIALRTGIGEIWGQGQANPGTGSLSGFKDFVRSIMVPYALWYQAYPELTVRQIWNNEHIRRETVDGAGEEEIARVIRRFGAAPTIPADLIAHVRVN